MSRNIINKTNLEVEPYYFEQMEIFKYLPVIISSMEEEKCGFRKLI